MISSEALQNNKVPANRKAASQCDRSYNKSLTYCATPAGGCGTDAPAAVAAAASFRMR